MQNKLQTLMDDKSKYLLPTLVNNLIDYMGFFRRHLNSNRYMIVVVGGDSSGKSVSRCDPAGVCDEEAHGPPAESVRQQRKSTVFFNRAYSK